MCVTRGIGVLTWKMDPGFWSSVCQKINKFVICFEKCEPQWTIFVFLQKLDQKPCIILTQGI